MQDKEFDELFKNRFECAEIEPSANLWSNIEEKLSVKRKRVFPVYWSAAAAIIAAVTIGLLFQQTNNVTVNNNTSIAQQNSSVKTSVDPRAVPGVPNNDDAASLQHHTEMGGRYHNEGRAVANIITEQEIEKKDLLVMQPSVVISHLEYKGTKVKQETVKLPEPVSPPVEEVMLASADITNDTNDNIDEVINDKKTESRGIRNVGDLVNYVVDKVDKREEKFIQFKTDNDDNSSLIGLNIGMFKFNQRKHK